MIPIKITKVRDFKPTARYRHGRTRYYLTTDPEIGYDSLYAWLKFRGLYDIQCAATYLFYKTRRANIVRQVTWTTFYIPHDIEYWIVEVRPTRNNA